MIRASSPGVERPVIVEEAHLELPAGLELGRDVGGSGAGARPGVLLERLVERGVRYVVGGRYYTPLGKPAEEVVRRYLADRGGGA